MNSVYACNGFCLDIADLKNDLLELDKQARWIFIDNKVSTYNEYSTDIKKSDFRTCITLFTKTAIQIRLWADYLSYTYELDKSTPKILKGLPDKPDINCLYKNIEDITTFQIEDRIKLFLYYLNIGKVVTATDEKQNDLILNLRDACDFIVHSERSWFNTVTSNCISSTVSFEIKPHKAYTKLGHHDPLIYRNRIYSVCLYRFAITALSFLSDINICPGCNDNFDEIILNENGVPVDEQANGNS